MSEKSCATFRLLQDHDTVKVCTWTDPVLPMWAVVAISESVGIRCTKPTEGATCPAWTDKVWTPLSDLPVPGNEQVYVNVRTVNVSTYRWLPYRKGSQQVRQGVTGRWQIANDYGWDNATLPVNGEWTPNESLQGHYAGIERL